MKWLFNPRLHRAPGSDSDKGGAADENSETKAIEAISEQVEKFQKILGDKADAEEFKKVQDELEALKTSIEEMTAKEVVKALESINAKNDTIHKQIVEMQEDIAANKDGGKKDTAKGDIVSTDAVKEFVSKLFPGIDSNPLAQKSADTGKIQITIKAAETFGYPQTFVGGPTVTDITAFTGRMVDPELNQRKRKRNLILDHFDIRTITVPTLIYLIKVETGDANPVAGDPGKAAWILSGQAKPKRSFRVTTGKVEAKKVAIFGTIEDKLLRDVPSFENWIREDFMDEIREEINDGLLNNDPAINPLAPLGLKTNAVQYVVTPAFALSVELANYIDAIIAAAASMANNKEEAGKVFVASDVFYRIHNLKATDGKWLNNNLIYVNALGQLFVAGVEVIPADIEDVPATHFLMIARDLGFKIYAYGDMVFEKGLNGEDFREDKTSYRGFQEFLSYIAENRENSVMYDTFANVFAAITKPVVP